MKIRLYLLQKICSKPPLRGWSWRGDIGCRGIGLLPWSSVSSSTSSAAFPRGRSLPLFIGGTKWHFLGRNDRGTERRDRKAKGQKGGTERLGQKGRDRTSRIPILYTMKIELCTQGFRNTYPPLISNVATPHF